MLFLASCGNPQETFSEVKNGEFKVVVRSQEFHNSAIFNVDICVAQTSSTKFPKSRQQCFFHGFDLNNLSVKWLSDHDIEVSFECGRVSRFTNSAFVYPSGPVPVEFYARLHDLCGDDSGDMRR
jgi:hypothetical protein